jgi:hypothetical protein
MPEMELFGPDLRLSLISGVWTRLFSYMFWPGDEQQRTAHCAKPYVTALSSIERKSADDPDYAHAYHIVHDSFRQIGGWSALETGFPGPLAESRRALRTAAAVLDIIRRTPREGSLNKAFYVIDATANTYGLIGNRTDIRKAWESHRSVAHLGVALVLSGEFQEPDFEDPARLGRFLSIARDYQMFATSYTMPRQQKPLVDRAEIWAIPAYLRSRKLRPLSPLPPDMLAALDTYRAPR